MHRIITRLGPHLALAKAPVPGPEEVLIVEGTLVPTQDRQVGASSKNYRNSANLQVLAHANTRLVLAVGDPLPGNRNDCVAYRASKVDRHAGQAHVVADGEEPLRRLPGGHRSPPQQNPGMIYNSSPSPSGKPGVLQRAWAVPRWKAPLDAFAITFDGRVLVNT